MSVQRERVHAEGEAEEVEVLAGVSDAVSTPEPHGVVEVTVDGLGVVTAWEEPFEVGVTRRDGPEVLGPVELAGLVVLVGVETDRDDLVVVASRQLIVVVPAVPAALVSVAVRSDARDRHEALGSGVVELCDAERATGRVETHRPGRAVGERDSLVFDVDVLLDTSIVATRPLRAGLGGGDPID